MFPIPLSTKMRRWRSNFKEASGLPGREVTSNEELGVAKFLLVLPDAARQDETRRPAAWTCLFVLSTYS